MRAVLSIAGTTIGESIRRKVLLIILLVGLLVLFIAPGLSVLSARSETTVLTGMMLGIIQLTSAVIAIVLTVYMLPNEIERRTIYTILSKPVQRWQFLVGKYLGAIGALLMMMVLMAVVLVITFFLEQGVRDVSKFADLLKAPDDVLRPDEPAVGRRDLLLDVRLPARELLPERWSLSGGFGVQSVLPDDAGELSGEQICQSHRNDREPDPAELLELQRSKPYHQSRPSRFRTRGPTT